MPKQIIPTKLGLPPIVHSSTSVRAGQFLFVSGLLGIAPLTKQLVRRFPDVDDEGRAFGTGMMSVDAWIEGLGSQGWQTFRNLKAVLEEGGSSLEQIIRLNYFSRYMNHHHITNAIRSKTFQPLPSPPNTGCQVLANPAGALFQTSAFSLLPQADSSGWKREIVNSKAATPVSHYDLGVQIGPFLMTGDLVPASQEEQRVVLRYQDAPSFPKSLRPPGLARDAQEEAIRAQTWFLYETIRQILTENAAEMKDVIKLTVYLVDRADAAAFADVHAAVFGDHAPVVAITTVGTLGRPEFRVAIEVNAVVPSLLDQGERKPGFLPATEAERVFASTSPGVVASSFVFLGSLAGIDERTGRPVRGYADLPGGSLEPSGSFAVDQAFGAVAAQTWMALERGKKLLKRAGGSLQDVASLHINLVNMRDIAAVDQVLRQVFPTDPPAVTVIQGPELVVADAQVEVEITAHLN